jgi:hypothetical protein
MRAEEVGSNFSIGEATDRLAVQSHPAGNGTDGQPLSHQLVDFGMPLLVPRRKPTWRQRCVSAQVTAPPGQTLNYLAASAGNASKPARVALVARVHVVWHFRAAARR